MADISISLNNVQNIKRVNIEGKGLLMVRKLGSGEELDLSTKTRRLIKIIDELSNMDFTKFDTKKPADLKKIGKLTKRAELLSEEVDEIKRFEFNTYKRCLSDNKGGAIVDEIMNTFTEEERGELFNQIFGIKKQIKLPDVALAEEAESKLEEKTNE